MTLDTHVYIHDPVDTADVFVKCNQIIGADEGTRFVSDDTSIWNKADQGLCAWLYTYHNGNAPLIRPGDHDRHCAGDEDDCAEPCGIPRWLEVSFDTSYGYHGPEGGCAGLHTRLVCELGYWLDSKNIRWSWRNEFTGEVHQRYNGFGDFCDGDGEVTWLERVSLPKNIVQHIARVVSDE